MYTPNKKYLIVFNDDLTNCQVTSDPEALYKSGEFDPDKDVMYQLGEQVTFKVVMMPVGPKLRSAGLKEDLGVGDYRG